MIIQILLEKLKYDRDQVVCMIKHRIIKNIHDDNLLQEFLENPICTDICFENYELDNYHYYDIGRYQYIEYLIKLLNK